MPYLLLSCEVMDEVCRYAPANELMAARRSFKRRKVDFLLYTERVHFYRRFAFIVTHLYGFIIKLSVMLVLVGVVLMCSSVYW